MKLLQEALQENIIDCVAHGKSRYTHDDLNGHIQNMENLRGIFKHSIHLEEKVTTEDARNCFAYIFDTELPLPPKFVKYLIEQKLLVLDTQGKGNIVIYFDNSTPIHGGKRIENFIFSKWNAGHIWKHRMLEVPTSYGENAKYFTVVNFDLGIKFKEYCKRDNCYIPERQRCLIGNLKNKSYDK